MRLARLDLTRYGRFTDAVLDFGAARSGQPDFHVIYGPNEAGKSTAFSAFLDLLFGIEPQSRFDFLHPYKTMRIGASLGYRDGTAATYIRTKNKQNSLLDAAERPVGDIAILGGLDREAYRAMFSLDDRSLEKGGESILASKGQLGELLFAASAGLVELGESLDALREEAEAFHRVRSRSDALSEVKRELDRLKTERDRLDTLQPAYKALVEARHTAEQRYREVLAERDAVRSRLGAVERQIEALPRLGRLRQLGAQAAPLAALPEPPPAWAEEFPVLERAAIEGAVQRDECVAEITRVTLLRDGIAIDERALAMADAIGRLEDSKYKTADDNLPRRRTTLAEQNGQIAGLLRQLGHPGEPDPERLILSASTVGQLRDLIEARSGVAAAHDAAMRQHADEVQALAEDEAALDRVGGGFGGGADLDRLKAVIRDVRADDQGSRRRLAERARAAQARAWQDVLPSLAPWRGDAEALSTVPVPAETAVARWIGREAENAKALATTEQDLGRLRQAVSRLKAECGAAGTQGGVVSDATAAALRAERERAWAEHRRDLAPASAEAFEQALRQDDVAVASRMGRDQELVRLRQAALTLASTEAELRHAEENWSKANGRSDALRSEIADAATAIGWAEAPSVADLQAWLGRRDKALAIRAAWREAEDDLADIETIERAARHRLGEALAAAGATSPAECPLPEALAQAEAVMDRETTVAGLRKQVETRRGSVAKCERQRGVAAAADEQWQSAWRDACAACWLGETGKTPPLAAVREILNIIAELGALLRERSALQTRIDQMEADQASFAQAVEALAASVSIPAGGTPLERADRLKQSAEGARAAHDRRAELSARLDELETRRREIGQAEIVHRQQVDRMQAFFGVTSLAEIGETLRRVAERRAVGERMRELETDVTRIMGAPTIEAVEALLSDADSLALQAERDGLAPHFDELDQRARELFASVRETAAAVDAVQADAAAARLAETRRTLLLDTEDKALRALRLKIGIAAAEQALRLYRETHRSSMMAHASDAFQTISRGAYSGLTAQPGEKGDVLVAVGPGGSKEASQLSKGTRFQLYLALRVAGYHEYCRTREPVPFVADDIMETFDDFRAEEAFRLFSQMGEVGQVIYLTHHRHLCDIARTVCPDVNIIELGQATPAVAA